MAATRLSLLLLLSCVIIGCGGSTPVYPVSGQVTVGGNPAPENTRVNFVPVGEGMAAAGIVDAQGNYVLYSGSEGLEGALAGEYTVFVTADASSSSYMESPTKGGVPGVATGPFPKEFTSEQTSPLKKTVAKEKNTINILIP